MSVARVQVASPEWLGLRPQLEEMGTGEYYCHGSSRGHVSRWRVRVSQLRYCSARNGACLFVSVDIRVDMLMKLIAAQAALEASIVRSCYREYKQQR